MMVFFYPLLILISSSSIMKLRFLVSSSMSMTLLLLATTTIPFNSSRPSLMIIFSSRIYAPSSSILSLEVARSKHGIFLNKRNYTFQLLKELCFLAYKSSTSSTPASANTKLNKLICRQLAGWCFLILKTTW